mmetsp:Transcript_25818/g.72300  ORF Transcript_25818/g.72300 Transcript_25818/m.72300 type:complete len:205 (-) Transcript_25818:1404-2018(-)
MRSVSSVEMLAGDRGDRGEKGSGLRVPRSRWVCSGVRTNTFLPCRGERTLAWAVWLPRAARPNHPRMVWNCGGPCAARAASSSDTGRHWRMCRGRKAGRAEKARMLRAARCRGKMAGVTSCSHLLSFRPAQLRTYASRRIALTSAKDAVLGTAWRATMASNSACKDPTERSRYASTSRTSSSRPAAPRFSMSAPVRCSTAHHFW